MTLEPRHIILYVVFHYLDSDSLAKLKEEVQLNHKKSDFKIIQIIEKYFDFKTLLKNPQRKEDVWIYNYLMYETKRPKKGHNPFQIQEKIEFSGHLLKKGLLKKYSNYLMGVDARNIWKPIE